MFLSLLEKEKRKKRNIFLSEINEMIWLQYPEGTADQAIMFMYEKQEKQKLLPFISGVIFV